MPNIKMPSLGPVDQNNQSEKQEYLDKNRHDDQRPVSSLKSPASPYQVMAGTIIPSTFITGIKGDLPGQIIGQVRENVYDSVTGRYLLIPQGTRLVGEYSNTITPGQDRLLIVWTRLLLPNGNSISLDGMPGVDLSGYAGVEDKVNYHFWRVASGAILSSLMGAGVSIAGGNNEAGKANFGQLAAGGAAQKIQTAGDRILDQMLNVQPTIEIRAGQKFNVFVNKDLILRPYR
jgi:type IV secretion system protein VirB10